jgi:hypothetical protein
MASFLSNTKVVFSVKADEAVRFVVNLMLLQLCYARKEMHANMSHIQHSSITRGIDLGIGYFKGTAPRLNFDEPGRASTGAQTAEPRRLTSSTISGLRVPFSSRPISAAKVVVGTHLAEVRGVVSSNMRSTCSRVKPLVSGIRK